jgi:hypothetical protein
LFSATFTVNSTVVGVPPPSGVPVTFTNGTYFSLMPLAIMRFNSARGLVNQPQ